MRRSVLAKILSGVLVASLVLSTGTVNVAASAGEFVVAEEYSNGKSEAEISLEEIVGTSGESDSLNIDASKEVDIMDSLQIEIEDGDATDSEVDSVLEENEDVVVTDQEDSDEESSEVDEEKPGEDSGEPWDKSQPPVYSEDFGIYEEPGYEVEEYGPVVSDYDESLGGDGQEITYDGIVIEDEDADPATAGNKVNIKNYKISISTQSSTNRAPASSYAARTANVITFFDYKGRLNVGYSSGQKVITVQVYEPSSMKLLATKKLDIPYKLFGSITCDDEGNYYVVCGQNAYKDPNGAQPDNEMISMCISKYDYNGKKLADLALKGKESRPYSGDDWGTLVPFRSANCAITVNNGIVALNYGRTMFNGHQSNMMIYAKCSDLTRIYANTAYTSHSFDQRVYADGSGFLALNHGDAYDRCFQITKINEFKDEEEYWLPAVDDFGNFHFREGANRDHGYNETFAQLGGMALLDTGYAFAGASERKLSLEPGPTSTYMGHNDARDLFVQILKKDFENYEGAEKYLVAGETRKAEGTKPSKSETELRLKGDEVDYGVIWLTQYDKNSYAANPKVFALTSDIFGLLWEKRTYEGSGVETYFMLMKTDGTKVRNAKKIDGCLLAADVDPVVKDGNIYWTTNDSNGAVVHVLNPSNISINKQPYIKSVTTNPDGSKSPILAIEADGAVSYQWEKSGDGKTWTNVDASEAEGANTNTLTIKTVQADYYRCLMVDDIGYKANSDAAFGFVQDLEGVYAEVETNAELEVQALGAADYKWMYSSDGKWKELSDSDITGANTRKVTIPMTEARFGYKYRCVITSLGGKTLNSKDVKIRHILKITKQPEDIFGELGKSYTATIEASGDGVSYTWYMIDDSTGSKVSITYKGYKTNKLTVKLDEKTENKLFVCVVKDTYGTEIESKQIIVAQTRGITAVPKKLTLVSKKGSTGTIAIKQTGVKYEESTLIWKSSDTSVATVNKGTVTAVEGLTESKTAEITITTPDNLYTDTCVVTVNPIPTVSAPEATLPAGTYQKGIGILLSTKTVGARIYYTTNGTVPTFDEKGTPTGNTKLFDEAIVLDSDMELWAVAAKENYKNSAVSKYKYTIRTDWGDIDSEALRSKFAKVQDVPDDVWYVFGNDLDGYTKVYTESAATEYTYFYTGSAVKPDQEIRVFHGTDRLWLNRDYKLSYKNNVKSAAADAAKAPTVTITGMGNYSKKAVFSFTIAKVSLENTLLTTEKKVALAAGSKLGSVKPALISAYGKVTLGKDFVAEFYKDSVAPANLIAAPQKEAVEAGKTYYIRLKAAANGGFSGTYPEDIVVVGINDKDGKSALMSKTKVTVPAIPYSGKEISAVALFDNSDGKTAAAKVEYAGRTLTYGKEFLAEDIMLMAAAGEYSVVLYGTEKADSETSFYGQKIVKVQVQGIPASKVKVAGLASSVQYLGRELTINDLYKADRSGFGKVTLYTANAGTTTELKSGTDYETFINGDGSKGSFSVEFVLLGAYSGTIKKNVKVTAYDLGKDTVKLVEAKAEDAVFVKSGAKAEVALSFAGQRLREGIDYTVSYKNNKAASGKSAPVAVIKGKGNFSGTRNVSFVIKKGDATNLEVTCNDVVYKEKSGAFKAKAKITEDGAALSIGKNKDIEPLTAADYSYYIAETGEELDDKAIVPAGTLIEVRAKVTCSASSSYEAGSYVIKGYYRAIDAGKDISKAKVSVDTKNIAYNRGKSIIPVKKDNLTVTLGKAKLGSSDYEIISVTGNRFLGTATVKIRGTGEYGGVKTFTYKIGAKALK